MADYEPVVRYTLTRAEATIIAFVLNDYNEWESMDRSDRMKFHRALDKLSTARKKQAQRSKEKQERKAREARKNISQ